MRNIVVALLLLCSGFTLAQAADDKVTIAAIEDLADVPAGEAVIRKAYGQLGIEIEDLRMRPRMAFSSPATPSCWSVTSS